LQYLRQNTAATIALGPAVDWRDGKTLLTETPTLTDLSCTLYKNGVAEIKSLTGDLTVDVTGMIVLTLSADDTDTAGRLDVLLANAVVGGYPSDVILPRAAAMFVVDEAVFESLTVAMQPPSRVSMV